MESSGELLLSMTSWFQASNGALTSPGISVLKSWRYCDAGMGIFQLVFLYLCLVGALLSRLFAVPFLSAQSCSSQTVAVPLHCTYTLRCAALWYTAGRYNLLHHSPIYLAFQAFSHALFVD